MFLKQLKLNNIRSYREETISFNPGSTILSGDIGSGKSSILLAIEFALFGSSRPDLPAELLLRNGAREGSVELNLVLNGQDIVIKRGLKKEKAGIKQTAGEITINKVRKELMPLEMKAEILSLLGYPEELFSKAKNYIFRYTVYTPQEEMKLILLDDAESRLNILRRIFNLDKYKTIRENCWIYLKEMRTKIAVLKSKIEPVEEHKQNLAQLNEKVKNTALEKKIIIPAIQEVKNKVTQQQELILSIDKQQQEWHQLQHKLKALQMLEKDKQNQLSNLEKQTQELKLEQQQLPIPTGINRQIIYVQIEELDKRRTEFVHQRSSLQQKVSLLQKRIGELQIEISSLKEQVSTILEKENILSTLNLELNLREQLELRKIELDNTLTELSVHIATNSALLNQAQDRKEKFSSLDLCPTCLQSVPGEHKNNLLKKENETIKNGELVLIDLKLRRSQVLSQKELISTQIEELVKKQQRAERIRTELELLKDKTKSLDQKQELLKLTVQDNNAVMLLLNQFKEQQLEEISQQLNEKQTLLQLLVKNDSLNKQLIYMSGQQAEAVSQLTKIKQELNEIVPEINLRTDNSELLQEQRTKLSGLLDQEKSLEVKLAQVNIKEEELIKQTKEIETKISKIKEEESQLIRCQELYHWLDQHFIKLTYTIEKQVMVNIHYIFNQLFQEWFSILIDDDTIYVQIDDTFTPFIQQNGYDTSFNNLSGGEKTSASLAYRLALNKVINQVIDSIKTKELLILDEPTDGFSTEQLDKVREVLERLRLGQIIVVSHESKIESFVDNVIRISKQGHVSLVN
ncbi:MAG TPA: SMC family ATPase [Candidatus Nanoarchaeia archaeon]|nr:SMC family ATPase [Candidatus Nanoarchaeia archaeon]